MRCHSMHEWMSLRLDGRLPAGETRALEAHLDDCAACAMEWARWQEIAGLFVGAPLAQPPADLTARVLARVSAQRRWQPLASSVVAMAAGFALLGLLTLWPLVGICDVAVTTARMPGTLGVASSVLAGLLQIAGMLAGAGRVLLRVVVTPQSVVVAVGYAAVLLAALAGWLRLVFGRRAPAPVQMVD